MMSVRERLRQNISAAFYRHGLLCASYPVPIILFTSASILACCYPLLKLPLPGTGPVEFTTGVKDYSVPYHEPQSDPGERPDWYHGAPVAYIQQVLVKAAVSPWDSSLVPVDVFRSPLGRVFSLLEELRDHVYADRGLESLCLQVTDLLPGLRRMQSVLPEHGCLLVSPGNYWQNRRDVFDSDPDILKTVQQHEPKGLHTSATLKDLLFGVPGKSTGVSLYSKKRVVTYAITIAFSSYDSRFVGSLRARLKQLHPSVNCSLREDHMVHIHFKEEIGIAELIPLVTTYIILFAYIYFSTRKIDMVRSKWGLALAAVVTVLSSLLMSVGLCTLFGLTPTLNGGEIFPYLVVVIGIENVLVLTKSVVSTPVDLEVKLRIAQGLSSESWSIMKNMATELVIILIGYFTLVPAIQEFCLFAVVGLVSDFFLQMFFFTTVLSIDIRRMELADLNRRLPAEAGMPPPKPGPLRQREAPPPPRPSPHTITLQAPAFRNLRLPKRLRVIYFLARTRLAQRIIMVGTVIWIGILVYTDPAGLRTYLAAQVSEQSPLGEAGLPPHLGVAPVFPGGDPTSTLNVLPAPDPTPLPENQSQGADAPGPAPGPAPLVSPQITWGSEDEEVWRRLSFRYWPSLFGYYNITLAKRYISILPVIPVTLHLSPQEAIETRHPQDTQHAPRVSARAAQLQTDLTLYNLRRSSSSGCWDQRDGWDHYDTDSSPRAESCTTSTPVSEYAVRRRPTRPALFVDQPDLTALIDTNFSDLPPSHVPSVCGYDFGGLVEKAYKEHEATTPPATMPTPLPPTPPTPPAPPTERLSMPSGDWESSVWSMELRGNLIAAGRSNGKLELWDAVEGLLRIVAARLDGSLDFFTVDINKPLGLLQHRGPPGCSSLPPSPCYSSDDAISCQLTRSVQCAHQKPITVLKAAAGRVVTGSQDHTVRVYRLEDSCCLFTLQGHSGGITAIYIDQTMVLASGGQDGAICLWDVLTGSRVSHVYGHRGDVTSLVCTTSCVISSGLDDLICIWDRSTGIKLYSIQQEVGCGASLAVISESLLVTGGNGCVSFWDLNYGDLLQTVYLGQNSEGQHVRQLLVLENAAIVCDFGSELSLVYVPSVLEKLD
ncbi:hypothetical protein PDJAM_G00129750 [Pangasius djambal]|uniref:Uncharacterized protein n=1 Tax=Pangasius djambal TaxID=1691987 RepID=A0ACC5ZCX8_9TELE|nr:hypothetical protein [Pangasius djambal]